MQARVLPALSGWTWITEGFRLFRTNPAVLTFLVFGFWAMLISINLIPFIGVFASALCAPAFSVSVMNACRMTDRGENVQFGLIFSGFQRHLRTLLILGAIYLAGTFLALGLSTLADGGFLFDAMLGAELEGRPEPNASDLSSALLIALSILVPLMMAFWFAPMLAAWDGLPAAKVLFFSFVACWQNWKALLVYGVAVFALSAVFPTLLLGVLVSLVPEAAEKMPLLVSLPLLLVLAPTIFASFYVSYRDVFEARPAEALPEDAAALDDKQVDSTEATSDEVHEGEQDERKQ